MRLLSAADLLEVWERGAGRPPVEQAAAILGKVFPDVPPDRLQRLTIARRDAALILVRERTFGSQIDGLAGCPACGERLELAFDTRDLPAGPADWLEPSDMEIREHVVARDGCEVRFRLPTGADLIDLATGSERASTRRRLLEACILSARRKGRQVAALNLPARVMEAVEECMADEGAAADLVLAVACPACGFQMEILFDIVSFFWAEIQARAMRLVQEVHALASAYGWSEADILGMSAWRRQRYLELVGV